VVFTRKMVKTMGRSKMERHEQYVWMVGGEHMSRRRKTSLDGSLHFLSFTTAHSEGGLGMGMKGSGSMLLHVRAFWMGFPRGWLWHRSYLNLSGPGFRGRGALRVRTARR